MFGLRHEIVRRIVSSAPPPDGGTSIDGLMLYAADAPCRPFPFVFRPSLYLVFQGSKRLLVGHREIAYGAGDLVLAGMDLPVTAEVTAASAEEPYAAVELALDHRTLGALAADLPPLPRPADDAITVQALPPSVHEPVLRLLRLLDDPVDARVLADGVKREILYRVLTSPSGGLLLHLAQADSVMSRIGRATAMMHTHLDAPLTVDALAERAAMSATSFHRKFKAATGTTPLAYHKALRLHEARRLVTLGDAPLAHVAAAVGYLSPSHFSRDYKREFGQAPTVDARRYG